MIYEPSDDSFLLQKYVKKYASGKVLDIGTGSGIQTLTALENTKYVLASDINLEAVKKVRTLGINVIKSDLFSSIKGKFDLIIFNPPYLPEDRNEDKESKLNTTAGKKGNEIIKRFLKEAKGYLNKNGKILIIFSSLSGDIIKLFKKYNYNFRLLGEKKLFFEKLYCCLLTVKSSF